MQIFTSVVVGVATWAVLACIGLEQAALWGLLAGIFNSIPYYGPLIVSGGLSVVAFLQFGTLSMTLMIAGVSLVITSLEGWLLTPHLMGKVASMNRVAVFVGLLFWSWAWGVWGLLLAVPMMMSIKVICDHVEDLEAHRPVPGRVVPGRTRTVVKFPHEICPLGRGVRAWERSSMPQQPADRPTASQTAGRRISGGGPTLHRRRRADSAVRFSRMDVRDLRPRHDLQPAHPTRRRARPRISPTSR